MEYKKLFCSVRELLFRTRISKYFTYLISKSEIDYLLGKIHSEIILEKLNTEYFVDIQGSNSVKGYETILSGVVHVGSIINYKISKGEDDWFYVSCKLLKSEIEGNPVKNDGYIGSKLSARTNRPSLASLTRRMRDLRRKKLQSGSNYYVCDQLDGLVKCMNDLFDSKKFI